MINLALEEFNKLVADLQSITGRKEKEDILSKYKENNRIKEILEFIYNPYITTGISLKKLYSFTYENIINDNKEDYYKFGDILDVLAYLKSHNTGRDLDVKRILYPKFLEVNPSLWEIYDSIVIKNLKLGVQPITLNKVFGKGFIPTFDVMLAEKYFDNPTKYLPEGTEFTLTTKLDGVRCVCICEENGSIKFYSRQGQSIEGLKEIERDIKKLSLHNMVLDGELLLSNNNCLLSKDLYRATVKETNKDGSKHNLIFNIFDCLGLKEFISGISNAPYTERRNILNSLSSIQLNEKLNFVKILPPLYKGNDQSKIQEWLDVITSDGGEGVMININNAPYECKRTKNLLKVKKMQTMDLKIIGMEEGKGVNKGRLGALKVEFPAPDGKTYVVDVGGGYTFEERDYIWKSRDNLIGKIIEVQYFEISKNEKNEYSLRFPVFKYFREDKTEPSVY